jgi:hypothetical protein
MSKNESTPEDLKAEAEDFLARITEFRRQMNLKEVRILKKCQETPDDTFGSLAGILWIYNRRTNPNYSFDNALEDYTEETIIEQLKKILPAV